MILGLDVSLDVCKAEGYVMVEFDGRKKFEAKNHYRVFCYYPEYDALAGELAVNTFVSFDKLVETYNENKAGLDSFAETWAHVNFENPTYHDLLNLANDIHCYMGLN